MTDLEWSETTSKVAAGADCQPNLVRQYSDEGLLESRRLPNGTRLFRADAAERVRKLKAERLALRGRHSRKPAVAQLP